MVRFGNADVLDLSIREIRVPDGDAPAASAELFRTFAAMDALPRFLSREAICCTGLWACGAWTAFLGWRVSGSVLLGAGAVWFARCLAAQSPDLEDPCRKTQISARRVWIAVALGGLLILAVVAPSLFFGGGGDERGPKTSRSAGEEVRAKQAGFFGGTYRGVILLTAPPPDAMVVPPMPVKGQFAAKPRDPLSIPFFGVYWMFRWPDSQPPRGSFRERKSPLDAVFRSSDRFPLSMEARQNFGRKIDLACCRRIELAVTTADGFATLDLMVSDTTVAGRPSLWLGRGTIGSPLDWRPASAGPKQMVVGFDVPVRPAIQRFDEARIVFNRAYGAESAKVSIDRFIFVPRGF